MRADGVTIGTMEDTGDTYCVCDTCGHVGGTADADCEACLDKADAAQDGGAN